MDFAFKLFACFACLAGIQAFPVDTGCEQVHVTCRAMLFLLCVFAPSRLCVRFWIFFSAKTPWRQDAKGKQTNPEPLCGSADSSLEVARSKSQMPPVSRLARIVF